MCSLCPTSFSWPPAGGGNRVGTMSLLPAVDAWFQLGVLVEGAKTAGVGGGNYFFPLMRSVRIAL